MDPELKEINYPVKFYTLQKRYITHVSQTVLSKGVLLIEAGTGFGKTLSNLVGILNVHFPVSRPQIIYLSKTHRQNEQVVNELEKINAVNHLQLVTGIQMASRRQLCHIEHVANSYPATALDLCKKYQEINSRNKSIPEYNRCSSCLSSDRKIHLPVVLTLDKLEKLALEYHGCAYLTARELLSDFDVITGHYNYFLNQDIKNAIGMTENKSILILDEGHNLEEILTDQYSATLSHYTFQNALKEANGVDVQLLNSITFLSNAFDLFIKTHSKSDESIFNGQEMVEYFASFGINETRIKALESRFKVVHESLLLKQKDLLGHYPNSLVIEELINFLKVEAVKPKDLGYIMIKLPKGYKIRKECLSPAIAFADVRQQALAIVICSGTLSPLPLWREILGLHESNSKAEKFGSLIDPRKVKVVVFQTDPAGNQLTTKYSHRVSTPAIYSHFLESVKVLSALEIGGGILLFLPSYDFLDLLTLPSFLGDVKCFQETQDAKESLSLLENFIDHVREGKKGLFAGVLGGKFSEGMDLPHELVRMVIIVGIPYPPPNDPIIQLKRNYYENQRQGLGMEWYNAQAFRKVSQALGRGWRTANDYSVGILLDNRFTYSSSTEQLPLWVKNNLVLSKNWRDGIQTVEKFFQQVKLLD